MRTWACFVIACGLWPASALAEPLQAGLYEITVRVALPNLGDAIPATVQQRCLSESAIVDGSAFAVLSSNNPLQACPRSDNVATGDTVVFRIVCAGPNKASASATFETHHDRFHGHFAMNMGGKNMTMSEDQAGRWIGACP